MSMNDVRKENGSNVLIKAIDKLPELDRLFFILSALFFIQFVALMAKESSVYNDSTSRFNSTFSGDSFSGFSLYRDGAKLTVNHVENLNELSSGDYLIEYQFFNEMTGVVSTKKLRFQLKERLFDTWSFKLFSVLMLLLLFLIVYVSRYRFMKKESQTRQLILEKEHYQIQLLKSQLNPHFLFNALNTLKAMVYVGQKSHSLNYIDKLSIFLRHVLNTNKELYTCLEIELKLIENYLEIEKCRLNEKLNYAIRVDEGIKSLQIPSNILQPIVENSIKYGLGFSNIGLDILVSCKMEHDRLVIKVSDNGPGPSESFSNASFSTESIRRRINVFNETVLYEALMIKPINYKGEIIGTLTVITLLVKTNKNGIN